MDLDDYRTYINELTDECKLTKWGYGEWVEEADRVEWTYKDVKCLILRNISLGNLLGYVFIPRSHPWANKGYDIDCECHGGITYNEDAGFAVSDECGRQIGFDCAHSGDLSPGYVRYNYESIAKHYDSLIPKVQEMLVAYREKNREAYKNIAFCIAQCESLVDQALQVLLGMRP